MSKVAGFFLPGFLMLLTLSICGCGGGGGTSADAGPSELSIVSTSPASGAAGVAVGSTITVTFSSTMDTSTLTSSTFTLTGPDGPITGSVSYYSGSRTATFSPAHSLPPLTQYTATITTGVKNAAGNALSSPYSWSFTTVTGFWAYNFVTNSYYFVNAVKVGEGQHCYVYIDQNSSGSVDQKTINAIVTEFDNAIYPGDTNAFGSEPDPGVDADPKIYLFLLDIKDGFNPSSNPTYIAGYFDSQNEYTQDHFSKTNLKEMFFMDIYPAIPGSIDFYGTLAHEFQHMIHWEQKTNLQGLNDDTWLDEGMSTVARTYCGLGTDTPGNTTDLSLLTIYEGDPSHSLTNWDSSVESYAVAYMWSQYFKDQFDPKSGSNTIFWRMMHNNQTGINEVDAALSDIGAGKNFTGAFRDWTVANAFGNNTPPSGRWAYTSLTGWPGIYATATPGVILSGATSLAALDVWSAGYYSYTPKSGTTGTITWNPPTNSFDTATLINTGGLSDTSTWAVTDPLTGGNTYSYTNDGYLIIQNPTGSSGGSDTVNYTALGRTPLQMLDTADRNPVLWQHYRRTGRPTHLCIDSYFREQESEMRAKGARPHFGPKAGK